MAAPLSPSTLLGEVTLTQPSDSQFNSNSFQFNIVYSNNIQQTLQLRPCEHAIHAMLFEGNTQEVKNVYYMYPQSQTEKDCSRVGCMGHIRTGLWLWGHVPPVVQTNFVRRCL